MRIPLNEHCWLGVNGVRVGGRPYQEAIRREVAAAQSAGLYVVLDLHWSAPGDRPSQNPMADADHSPESWRQVARAYADNPGVLFDLYNEHLYDYWGAIPDRWAAWRDGAPKLST